MDPNKVQRAGVEEGAGVGPEGGNQGRSQAPPRLQHCAPLLWLVDQGDIELIKSRREPEEGEMCTLYFAWFA